MVTAQRRYGFGIIGCGVIAPTHAAAVAALPNAHLVAVTDAVPGKGKSFAAERGVAWEADPGALLARPNIDVVSVCVPSGRHADIGVEVARAGKHLVMEAQIADFLAALDSGRQPLVTGEEARASVAVIRAVYDSAISGRSVAPAKRH